MESHVTSHGSVAKAVSAERHIDALLLDSGSMVGPTRELGGTGRTHDWSLSRQICKAASVPVLLAGSLPADNARAALPAVDPFGLDICSGVRSDGNLDATKLAAFVNAARLP